MNSPTITATVSSRLAEIVGDQHVATDFKHLSSYEIDRKLPAAVVRPGSSEEVAEIVKFAASEKLALVPCGARTKLRMGFAPSRYDLALDMTRLDRIVAYDPGDLTLSVEPGVPLRRLQETLAEHRQFLPVASIFYNQATVGGLIASGVDSPFRQSYGTPRDFLLGMEFVTGEGVAAKSGGRVVKNVTGYDIHKLMIGALGTLGVITRVNFKTFPMHTAPRGLVARFANAENALDMRRRIAQSALSPLAIEILSPRVAELFASDAAAKYASAPMPPDVISPSEWALSAGYDGNDRVLERYSVELQRMAQESRATAVSLLAENLPAAWTRQREFIPIALAFSPATTIVKMSVLPMRMKEALAAAQAAAESRVLPWAALARGVGVIYFALLPEAYNGDSQARVTKAAGEIQQACAQLGGHATIPWCPADWKSALQIWGPPRPDFPQMEKLKQVFDPQSILSPGRFVGGL
ncbi:MAG: FAD-binding oxidoreductase [Candidatus Acidiferrales bacterium]